LGLAHQLPAAARWCDEQGATFLEEVAENAEHLAEVLDLTPEEAQRICEESRGALAAALPAPTAPRRFASGEDSAGLPNRHLSLRAVSTATSAGSGPSVSGDGAGTVAISRVLTINAAVKSFKRSVSGKAHSFGELQRQATPEGEEGAHAACSKPQRTLTCTVEGPMCGLIASLPVKDKTLSIAEVHRADLHRGEGQRGLRHCDTVGMELSSSTPAKRQGLVQRVHTDDLRPVSIDDGQTGTVYALEVGGEKIAVFKPIDGEKFSRKSLDVGQGAVREEAVYLVDRFCGSLAGVPVTSRASVEVDGRSLQGSVQAFVSEVLGPVEDFGMPRDLALASEFIAPSAVEALALLDMWVFNMDRHSGNLLLLGRDKPHGLGPIDHGCCLPPWWCLGEAIFDAWITWPHLECEPSASARELACTAAARLPEACEALRGIGLDSASIVTLRLCTLLVRVGIAELGMPCHTLAMLMLRDEDTGFAELSWLESKVLACAVPAGATCQLQVNDRGDQELAVEDDGAGLDVEAFLTGLEEAFRADLKEATATPASANEAEPAVVRF